MDRRHYYTSCDAELSLENLSDRQSHLHPGVDAHVLQERPLSDGAQTGHAASGHPPQEAEVHVGGEVGRAGGGQDVVELVTLKTLTEKKHFPIRCCSLQFSEPQVTTAVLL